MPHDLGAPLQAEVEKPELRPFIGVHIDLPDPVHAVTGNATIGFAGETWTAIGGLASLDPVGESTDGAANGVVATLNQIPEEFREDLADQAVRGCAYEIYVGALTPDFLDVTGFKKIWKGSLQGYEIVDGGSTLSVRATGESRAIDQRRPSIKRFTSAWQQRKYPGDRFFEYLPQMAEVSILWARAVQDSTVTGGSGGGGGFARNANVQLA